MRNNKSQKGITLIALIITIIILLILAMVTISAVKGDSIIKHAKDAATNYEEASEKEQEILQGYGNYLESAQGNKPGTSVPDSLVKYVLGADKKGRDVSEIVNLSNWTCKDDPNTLENESETIQFLDFSESADATKGYGYIKYNGKAYKTQISMQSEPWKTEKVGEIYRPQGNEGKTVKYDGDNDGTAEEWIVITDRNGKLEIVSKNPMGTLQLGSENADEAIEAYNNAIETINNYCDEIVKATNNGGVRSVGTSEDNVGNYNSANFNLWYKGEKTIKSGDHSYEQDKVKLGFFGIRNSTNPYWFASRAVKEISKNKFINFEIYVSSKPVEGGIRLLEHIWQLKDDGTIVGATPKEYGVRPVVINPSDIQYID